MENNANHIQQTPKEPPTSQSVPKSVARYIFLPGFLPRINSLFTEGFVYTAFLVALIFQSVRLLPPNHPYLNPQNRGKYRIRHVISQAANNLVIDKRNIDQILVFSVILAGLIMLGIQVILLVLALFAQQPVLAQVAVNLQTMFFVDSPLGHGFGGTVDPSQDIAFSILDRMFGLQGVYDSCVSTAAECVDMHGNIIPQPPYPYAFHTALHGLLEFYSLGIFVVAVFVIIYYVITITAEAAVSGSPFGQRTNRVWAPIRLIAFLALLVPLNTATANGLNSAQLITFWTAKFGSNFATNAWGKFNQDLFGVAGQQEATNRQTYLGQRETLLAKPEIPSINGLIQFMFVAKTCKYAQETNYPDEQSTNFGPHGGIQAYVIRPSGTGNAVGDADSIPLITSDYETALAHVNNGNITIRFGLKRTDADAPLKYKSSWGYVYGYCGEVVVATNDLDPQGRPTSGSKRIQEIYYDLVRDMWAGSGGVVDMSPYAECVHRSTDPSIADESCNDFNNAWWPNEFFMSAVIEDWNVILRKRIMHAVDLQLNDDEGWQFTAEMRRRGWAGAAIWYNVIAKMNGEVTTAIFNPPKTTKYPTTMERVARQRKAENANIDIENLFNPVLKDGTPVDFGSPTSVDMNIATTLYKAFDVWEEDDALSSHMEEIETSIFINTVNRLFGTYGLFSMRDNDGIHPLAKLSSLGKAMMEASARNIGLGMAGGAGKSFMEGFSQEMSAIGGKFFETIGWAAFSMSFTLYYVLPFLSFIYFFFAAGGWCKTIIEAIFAMPLFALAHLKTDGDGLPGQYAINGYFLLFEIFLRPILIVFGLLFSMVVFAELVNVLNDIFDLVLANVAGFDYQAEAAAAAGDELIEYLRSPVDRFFYTALYTIICFLLGQSCFKMVDTIPNEILRWMGSNVSTFQKNSGQEAAGIMDTAYMGTNVLTGQLKGGALALL